MLKAEGTEVEETLFLLISCSSWSSPHNFIKSVNVHLCQSSIIKSVLYKLILLPPLHCAGNSLSYAPTTPLSCPDDIT